MYSVRKAEFPVNGQGVFTYTAINKPAVTIFVTSDEQSLLDEQGHCKPGQKDPDPLEMFDTDNFISLTIGYYLAEFKIKITDEHKKVTKTTLTSLHNEAGGMEYNNTVSYWFSYDREALLLKYGKGHVMTQTTLMEYGFLKEEDGDQQIIRKKYEKFFNARQKKVCHCSI